VRRHCDGTDEYLIRRIDRMQDEEPTERGIKASEYEPCACGLTFDDAERMTVYPHLRLASNAIERFAQRGRG